jgi:hypothetical protein
MKKSQVDGTEAEGAANVRTPADSLTNACIVYRKSNIFAVLLSTWFDTRSVCCCAEPKPIRLSFYD